MKNQYDKEAQALRQKLEREYSSYSYDAEADELYRLVRNQLERGRSAGVSDALARYAAASGMGGSSEAMAAAAQTANRYDTAIADALLSSEARAYDRWTKERAAIGEQAASLQAMADAQRKRNTRGANGMTEEQYKATREALLSEASFYDTSNRDGAIIYKRELDRIYKEIEALDSAYNAPLRKYTEQELKGILEALNSSAAMGEDTVVSYEQYVALADYFADYGGEDYLRAAGIYYYVQ